MNKDTILKKIDCIRDVKNHLWTSFLISTGGTISLFLNLNTNAKKTFFVAGIFLSITLFVSYFKKDDSIEYLLENLEKEE